MKTIHEQGLVSALKEIHYELDASVAEAYGWPVDLTDEVEVAKAFSRAKKDRVGELLATLAAIGRARRLDDGRYVAA